MSQELAAIGDELRSVLDRYVRACSSAQDTCLSGVRINSIPDLVKILEKESCDISSYTRKLEDARAIVHTARNSIPKVALVNELPAEVLAYIFQLVLPGQSCLVQKGPDKQMSKIKYASYPDALAHVCSFWRRVATSSPGLWTHIDIVLDHVLNPGLFARAKVYATRAGQLPLEVHISDPGSERERNYKGARPGHTNHNPSHDWDDLNDFKFLASPTAPIRTLELDLRIHSRYRETYYSLLEYFFAHSQPGVLTQYTAKCVNSQLFDSSPFIEPAETPHTLTGALLAVPSADLEELWLRIPIVQVNCLCPHYKSKIYHGLTELRIGEGVPEITESQLINILRSSPKLQVFHLNAEVYDPTDEETIEIVYLEDLKDINVMIRRDYDCSALNTLRWIVPGSQPLRVAYFGEPFELVSFFSRANVRSFYIAQWASSSFVPALKKSPQLDILVLNGFDFEITDLRFLLEWDSDPDEQAEEAIPPSPTPKIDTLYLLWHLELPFEDIQAVVEKYSVQKLYIYYGELSYPTDEGRVVCDNTRNIRAKLATITTCTIKYFPKVPSGAGDSIDPDDWIDIVASSRL